MNPRPRKTGALNRRLRPLSHLATPGRWQAKKAWSAGFEPARAEHSGFLVHPLNRLGTTTALLPGLASVWTYPSGYGGGLLIHCALHAQVRILPFTLFLFVFPQSAVRTHCCGRVVERSKTEDSSSSLLRGAQVQILPLSLFSWVCVPAFLPLVCVREVKKVSEGDRDRTCDPQIWDLMLYH